MKKHNNEHSVFKKIVRFLKKNRGSYVLVCLITVIVILVLKAFDSFSNGSDFKSYLSSIIDLKTFVTIVLVFIITGITCLIGGLFAPKAPETERFFKGLITMRLK